MTNGEFYLYQGRHGETILTKAGKAEWDYLVSEMEEDNRATIKEIIRDLGENAVSGSFEEGYLSIDDGGEIVSVLLTEL